MSNMKPSEFAKKIGVSVKTLQRWDNDGTLKANRNPKGRRYYTDEQVREYNINEDDGGINCSNAIIENNVVKITNNEKSIYLEAGMIVCVMTDGTDFDEEYFEREVIGVDESELRLEDDDIPWDYIRSISIIAQSKETLYDKFTEK